MDWPQIVISFIVSGGLSVLFTWKIARKKSKLDYAEKAVNFWENQYDRVQSRYEIVLNRLFALEIKVEELHKLKCTKADCENRIP